MILNLSPLAVHLQESLTSLRFATKVCEHFPDQIHSQDSNELKTGKQHEYRDRKEAVAHFVNEMDISLFTLFAPYILAVICVNTSFVVLLSIQQHVD